ncbi:MAG: zinc ribbon domain-containing protein [Acidobacteria bacterium]|nr:zinc ribbon domain-containing protein [Acidobacteriota bacterium]
MPLYEYKCKRCDSVFEVIQKFSDAPLAVHEGCGGEVERLLSSPALQFKGSGWYITDYAKSGGRSSGSNGTKSESKSETKSETKSESKPAATDSSKK